MEVRSRSHGSQRAYFYACSVSVRRGRTICPNRLELPLDAAKAAVLDALEQELLTPDFVETVVRKVLTRAVPSGREADEARERFTAQLGDVRRELDNLIAALASVGHSPAVIAAIKDRESHRAHLERELAGLDQREQVSQVELTRLESLPVRRSWSGARSCASTCRRPVRSCPRCCVSG